MLPQDIKNLVHYFLKNYPINLIINSLNWVVISKSLLVILNFLHSIQDNFSIILKINVVNSIASLNLVVNM